MPLGKARMKFESSFLKCKQSSEISQEWVLSRAIIGPIMAVGAINLLIRETPLKKTFKDYS